LSNQRVFLYLAVFSFIHMVYQPEKLKLVFILSFFHS